MVNLGKYIIHGSYAVEENDLLGDHSVYTISRELSHSSRFQGDDF